MRWLLGYAAFLAVMSTWFGRALSADGPVYVLGFPAPIGIFLWFGTPVLAALAFKLIQELRVRRA
jgi:hypothetical protein